jgi:Holliday junction resolvase RusA-like endonuclease
MKEHKIIIPGELTDLNTYIRKERGNRFSAAKIKQAETTRCMCWFLGRPKLKGKLEIAFKWYSKNAKKDPDNISFSKKFILDGMVKAKFIDNDGQKTIKRFSGEDFLIDKNNPRVEIEIEEVKNGTENKD